VPLHTKLSSGDIVEIITSKSSHGPSRDWLDIVNSPRARQKIRQHFRREQREDSEHSGRDLLQEVLRREGLPAQKILSSKVFGQICKEIGYAKPDDLFAAIGAGNLPVKTVANKVIAASDTMKETTPPPEMLPTRPAQDADEPQALSGDFGIAVEGMSDIMIRMAKCCKPIPGDDIVGYISLGKGITVHRSDCKNARALMKNPERFTKVGWQGLAGMAFRVEIMVEALDRNHLLEDVARALGDSGVNILSGSVQTLPDGVVRDRFTIEVGDVRQLDNILANIRAIDTVYDAYRVVG
jgi:GTP pyrophosphokinase